MLPELRSVSALVASFNTRDATLGCLAALENSRFPSLQVIVADNGSSDGTVEAISARYPGVALVEMGGNAGYGRANNRAFEFATGAYVLVLNSDCFVGPHTLDRSVAFLEAHPSASAVACQLRNPDGSIQPSCRRFPSLAAEVLRVILPYQLLRHLPYVGRYYMGGWSHDRTRTVEQPAGAFLLMRRNAWGAGPPFDERFFMYYEDVDLCRRLWHVGPIWFLSDVWATHIGEHSSRSLRTPMAAAVARSRHQYYRKWHGASAARIASMSAALASALRAFAWAGAALVSSSAERRSLVVAHWTAAKTSFGLAIGSLHA